MLLRAERHSPLEKRDRAKGMKASSDTSWRDLNVKEKEPAEDLLRQSFDLEESVCKTIALLKSPSRIKGGTELRDAVVAVRRWFNKVDRCLVGTLTYSRTALLDVSQRAVMPLVTDRPDLWLDETLFKENMRVARDMLRTSPEVAGTPGNVTGAKVNRAALPLRKAPEELLRDAEVPPELVPPVTEARKLTRKGNITLLKKADGSQYETVDFPTAERYAAISRRRRQQLIKDGHFEVVGKGPNRRIKVPSLIAYCPPTEDAK